MYISHRSEDWEVQDQGIGKFANWGRSASSPDGRGQGGSLRLFLRALIPFMKVLSRATPPDTMIIQFIANGDL